jgi:8-oxo-dGTP diphosphatase
MARKPTHSAGGVVVRKGARRLIAVVRRSKDGQWVLPRGKLKRNENARAGARREAAEETGHKVSVHDFLGAIVYRAQGGPKLVQFWHMRAGKTARRPPLRDIAAVAWLPLPRAVKRLSYPLERLFLQGVARDLASKKKKGPAKGRKKKSNSKSRRAPSRAGRKRRG